MRILRSPHLDEFGGYCRQIGGDHLWLWQVLDRQWGIARPGHESCCESRALGSDGVPHVRGDHAAGSGWNCQLLSNHVIDVPRWLEGSYLVHTELMLKKVCQPRVFEGTVSAWVRRRVGACDHSESGIFEHCQTRRRVGMGFHCKHAYSKLFDVRRLYRNAMDFAEHFQNPLPEGEEICVEARQGHRIGVQDQLIEPIPQDLAITEKFLEQRRKGLDIDESLVDVEDQDEWFVE